MPLNKRTTACPNFLVWLGVTVQVGSNIVDGRSVSDQRSSENLMMLYCRGLLTELRYKLTVDIGKQGQHELNGWFPGSVFNTIVFIGKKHCDPVKNRNYTSLNIVNVTLKYPDKTVTRPQ